MVSSCHDRLLSERTSEDRTTAFKCGPRIIAVALCTSKTPCHDAAQTTETNDRHVVDDALKYSVQCLGLGLVLGLFLGSGSGWGSFWGWGWGLGLGLARLPATVEVAGPLGRHSSESSS